MGRTITIERHVEIEVELALFSTSDLVAELRARGLSIPEDATRAPPVISDVWENRKKRETANVG